LHLLARSGAFFSLSLSLPAPSLREFTLQLSLSDAQHKHNLKRFPPLASPPS